DVLFVLMIVVVGDVASVVVLDVARHVREAVPDGLAFVILVPSAFDLVRRCAGAPVEAIGKRSNRSGRLSIGWWREGGAAECRRGKGDSRRSSELDRRASGEFPMVGFHGESPASRAGEGLLMPPECLKSVRASSGKPALTGG